MLFTFLYQELKMELLNCITDVETYQTTLKQYIWKSEEEIGKIEGKRENIRELMIRKRITPKEIEDFEGANFVAYSESVYLCEKAKILVFDAKEFMEKLPLLIESAKALLGEWANTKPPIKMAEELYFLRQKLGDEKNMCVMFEEFEKNEIMSSLEELELKLAKMQDEVSKSESVFMEKANDPVTTELIIEKIASDFVSLRWERKKNEDDKIEEDEYCVYMQEVQEGVEGKYNSEQVYKGKENCYDVYPLKPETRYKFRVMIKHGGNEKTQWSNTQDVKTLSRTVVAVIDEKVRELKENMDNAEICRKVLAELDGLIRDSKLFDFWLIFIKLVITMSQ